MDEMLRDFYTKTEVDDLLDVTETEETTEMLRDFYTKSEVDTLIEEHSGGSEIDGTITALWEYGIDNTKSFAKQCGNTIAITITAANSVSYRTGNKKEIAQVSGLVLPASLDGAIVSAGLSNFTLSVGSSGSPRINVNVITEYVDNQTLKLSTYITFDNAYMTQTVIGTLTITAIINLPE